MFQQNRDAAIAAAALVVVLTVACSRTDGSGEDVRASKNTMPTESQRLNDALSGKLPESFPECEYMRKQITSRSTNAEVLAVLECMHKTAASLAERLVFARTLYSDHSRYYERGLRPRIKPYMDENYKKLATMADTLNPQQLSALCDHYEAYGKTFSPVPIARCQN